MSFPWEWPTKWRLRPFSDTVSVFGTALTYFRNLPTAQIVCGTKSGQVLFMTWINLPFYLDGIYPGGNRTCPDYTCTYVLCEMLIFFCFTACRNIWMGIFPPNRYPLGLGHNSNCGIPSLLFLLFLCFPGGVFIIPTFFIVLHPS